MFLRFRKPTEHAQRRREIILELRELRTRHDGAAT